MSGSRSGRQRPCIATNESCTTSSAVSASPTSSTDEPDQPRVVGGVQLLDGGVGVPAGPSASAPPRAVGEHVGVHASSTRSRLAGFTRVRSTHRRGAMATDGMTACSARSSPGTSPPTWCTRPTPRGVPRPRAAGADPRAGDPAQPLRRTPPRSAAAEPGDAGRPRRRRGGGRRPGGPRRGLPAGLQHRRRPPTRPCSTPTCTCSAAARWAGRRDEPPAHVAAYAVAARRSWSLAGRGACSTADRTTRPQARRRAASASSRRTPATADDQRRPRRSRASRCARASGGSGWRCPTAYTPSAPYGTGTDDYRCFLLDPHLTQDAFITGLNILPGQPEGRAPRDPVPGAARRRSPAAEAKDARRRRARAGPASAAPACESAASPSTTRPGSAPGRPAARSR